MKFTPLAIPEVILIEPKVFGDERGFFMETWSEKSFVDNGINASFVQDNHSFSVKGILRGLHYQTKQTQGKLVRVTAGAVFDVVVDIRRNSPTLGQYVSAHLSAENKQMLWVPLGFAHGFVSLSDKTEFLYKCTDFYAPEYERTILWNDPDLAIKWPLKGIEPQLSAKDEQGVLFKSIELLP
ncbi:MAG: dTDP-4-dehydrorhamnose 3,5-epimerase [Colwellia sp.]|jgi:dTDP-4-dehydrorhamnose 3,5-epimerase